MKSFKRRALAFVVTTAMVLTSLVVPAFAASNEIDATGLTAAEDGKSYYSGTLKYEYAGGTIDLKTLPGYDAASYNNKSTTAILFFESSTGTGHWVETTAKAAVTIDSNGLADIDPLSFTSSDIVDDLFKLGEYSAYIRIFKNPADLTAGNMPVLESTNSIKVIPDIEYPEPVITKDAVGGNWEFEVDIPADTFGEAVLMVQPAGGAWAKKGGWSIKTTGTNTITSKTAVNAGDRAYVALQLYDNVIGSLADKYYVPVDKALTMAALVNGALANGGRNVRSAIVTAGSSTPTPAAPTAAPEFVDVNGNTPASDGKIYVKQATDYDVKLVENAADTGKTLPDKTVTYGTTTVSADPATGIATLAGVLPAAANTYSLVAAYDGVAALTNTIDLVVRDKAELTVSPNYYMSAAGVTVSGTSPEVDGEITVTFADSNKEILAVDAAGNWSVTVPHDAAKAGAATVKVENLYTGYTVTENTNIVLSTVTDIKAEITDTTNYTLTSPNVYDTYLNDNFKLDITAEAGEQVKVTLDGGTPQIYTSTGTDTITVSNGSPVAAGAHTVKVEYVTAAGAPATITINVLGPTTPLKLVVTTTPIYSQAGMVINGTVDPASTVTIRKTSDNSILGSGVVDASGNWTATADLSSIAPGAGVIYAYAERLTVNDRVDLDVAAVTGAINIDLANSPDLVLSNGNYYVTNTAAGLMTPITVKVTGTPGEEVEVKTTDTTGGTGLTDKVTLDTAGEGMVTLTPSASLQFVEGEVTLVAAYTNPAVTGSVTRHVYTDVTAPTLITINTVTDGDAAITGTTEPFATVNVTVDGTALTPVIADAAGNWSVAHAASAGETIEAQAVDPSGNMGATATATVQNSSAIGQLTIVKKAGSAYGELSGIYYTNSVDTIEFTVNGYAMPIEVTITDGTGTKTNNVAAPGDVTLTTTGGEIPGAHLVDGTTYTITAKYAYTSYQGAGYDSEEFKVVVDHTAPVAAVINTVEDSATEVTGKAEAGATLKVYNGTTLLGTVVADAAENWSVPISGQAAGDIIKVEITDVAGNAGPDATSTVIATSTVAVPVVTPDYNEFNGKYYSNVTSEVKFNVAAEAGMNVNVYIDTVLAISNQPAGDFTYTIPLGTLSEGEYTIKAEYVAPGYTAGTATLVIDTTKPNSATINEVNDKDTTVTGNTEPGAAVEAFLNTAPLTSLGTATADATTGDYSITIAAQAAGTEIIVRATDVAGNINSADAMTTVVVTAITDITITTANYTNNQVQLDITVDAETGRNINLYVNGAKVRSDVPAGTFNVLASEIPGGVLSEGVYEIKAEYAAPGYGEKAVTEYVTVDVTAPVAIAGLDNIYDDDTAATLTLEAMDVGSTVELTIGTDVYTETDADGDGTVEFTISTHPVDTAISAVVTDLAGNASAPITGNKVLKRTGVKTITVTTANAFLSRPTDIIYTVDAEAGRAIEATISLDGDTPVALATPVIGDNTVAAGAVFPASTTFPEGTYVITVKYADPAYDELTGTVTITVINDAPTPAILDPNTGDNETTEITGKVLPMRAGLTAYVDIDGVEYSAPVDPATGEFTIDISAAELEVGDVLEVNVRDAAGNVAVIPATYTSHEFTVTAKDIAKIILTPKLTFDSTDNKYYADNTEILPSIKVEVEAQAGYDVKVSIDGPNVPTTFDSAEITITGSGTVEFMYNATVAGYGFAPEAEYAISAEYVKHGFDDKKADNVAVAVVKEEADKPVINRITDRDLTITGTNAAFATVEVSFDDGATWLPATIDATTDNTVWSYTLTDTLTAGDKVLARQTLKGGKVSDNAEATVVFADVIDLELGYGTDCAAGTTHDTDKFDIILKADEDRKVIVTVKHVQDNGIVIIPDGWDGKEITADGTEQTFTVERDAADTHYEEGEWVVTAEYKDKAAMEAQGDITGILDATITVMVIGDPQAPVLVEPIPVTNRTTVITVEMGDYAKTAKVCANGTDITADVTVTKLTDNKWNIELPMQLAGTELEIKEVDTSDVESAEALEITVAYDDRIAIAITATSVDTDRVADLHLDAVDLVISGTTAEVLDGTAVIVSAVSASDAAYKLTDVTTTVTGNAWTATFTYDAAAFSGLKEGEITITATLNDERTPEKLTDVVTIVNDKTTPDAPVIAGSKIDGTDVDGKLTTRSTELYGTALNETDGTITAVVYDTDGTAVETLNDTVDTNGDWRVTFGTELKVGYRVDVTVTDLAGHVSPVATANVTTAEVQKYELTIDDLANPYVNTLALNNGNETDGKLTFTGTTTAHDTDKVRVTINVPWGGANFTKEATVSGGAWTVTFGGDPATATLIKRLSDTTLIEAEKTEGTKVTVKAAYAEEGVTVSDEDTTNNTTTIYPDSTAPTAPVIVNEPVYNRATEIKVESTTDYPYSSETPADKGMITLYAGGTAITPTAAPQFDFATKTWTIEIDALGKDVALTATETDMAGNESAASEAKTVVEAIEGDDKPAGEVDELIIKEASDGREYTINDVKYLYLNNTVTTNLTLSGDGANEMVRVSFKSLDNGHNADSVITGAKEFMISGNKWDVELNLGALINALPENRYEFKIEYLNTGNSATEGVIGEDYVIIVIDNKAPEALTVNTVYDRDLTISGGNLDTYPDAPVNNELWFMVEEADGSVRTVWTELDPAKVTNVGGVWTVNKADLGLDSGIRKELGTKVSFKQVDRAGNESAPAAVTIVELTSQGNINAKDIKIISPANKATVARGTTQLTIKGTAEPNERISVKIDDVHEYTVDEMTVNADGTWEVTFGNATTAEFTTGTHTITAKYLDIKDNVTGELYSVTSIFRVPAESKPSSGGGGGGSSAKWDDITVTEKTVPEGTGVLNGKGERGKDVAIYFKEKDDKASGMGTLVGKATVDSQGVWRIKETSDKFKALEAGDYILNATYDLGEGTTRGKYGNNLTITAKDPADSAYILFTVGSHEFKVDGVAKYSDVAPYIDSNDRTMLPLRAFANALSISDEDISWNDATKTATIVRPDGKKVIVQVGRNVIIVNGEEVVIDTIPVIKDSRVFLPLRAMLNAFGIADSRIVWNAEKGQIIIVQDAKADLQALVDAAEKANESKTEE